MNTLLTSLDQNPFFSGGLTLMVIGSIVALLRKLPSRIWALLERRISIAVEVSDRDPAFRWVQAWLGGQSYTRRAHDLSLITTWVSRDPDPTIDSDPEYNHPSGPASEARFLLSPAPGTHLMTYRGRLLILYRTRRDLQNGGAQAYQESLRLQILGGNRTLVEELLSEAHKAAFPTTPGVSILTACGACWSATSWQARRPMGSLVLADEILEDNLADLREFYRSQMWYAERGIPYRRGYLLHGPPGTGKTTLVLALAGELGLSVAVLNLSNRLMTDDALRTQIDALPVGSIR